MKIGFDLWEDEKMLFYTRFHKAMLLPKLLSSVLYFGIPISIISFLVFFSSFREVIFHLVLLFFALATAISFSYYVWLWSLSGFYVTNRRVKFIHKKSPWSGKRAEIRHESISEVVSVKKSFWNTLFGFGSVIIYPVSGTERFKVPFIPDSQKVTDFITEVCAKYSSVNKIEKEKNVQTREPKESDEKIEEIIKKIPKVVNCLEMDYELKDIVAEHQEKTNRGVFEVLRRMHVYCLLVDEDFKYLKQDPNEKSHAITLEEIPNAIGTMPGIRNYLELSERFQNKKEGEKIFLIGV